MTKQQWKAWLLAARPKTLTAAVSPILVATALSQAEQGMAFLWITGLALLASLLIQIGTNLVNDAMDFKKGADTAERIGPKRVTQSGLFTGKQVLVMATIIFISAILCGVPLVIRGGPPIFWIGIISVLMGYGYTSGPFPLAYKGLGDLFVILFFGLIAVGGVYFLHSGMWTLSNLIAGLQVGFHCTVMIAINNLRDIHQDKLVGKKTLPVRFGMAFGRWEIAVLSGAPFLLGLYWASQGKIWAFVLPLILFPLALRIVKLVFETVPSPAYNQFLGKAAALHFCFGILLSVGLLI